MPYVDRTDAGRHLAHRLRHLRGADVVVLGLPRGGVPVAFEVAEELHAPLDVIVVRKLGVPFQPEHGFGAIGEDGVRIVDDHVVRQTGLTGPQIAEVEARERVVLDRRVSQLRGDHPPAPLAARTAIIVDDGTATGSTARAAYLVAEARGARRVILAVPVGSVEGTAALRRDADEVVCLHTPARFSAIGEWYDDFSQVTDEEVAILLGKAVALAGPGSDNPDSAEVMLNVGGARLPGSLVIPDGAGGLVVFAHSSGSSRHSPRNQFVAAALNRAGLGTLLADLLTGDEELSRAYVFNIPLLAARLAGITGWLRGEPATAAIPLGYFGASTGAAAALWAAGASPALPVTAVVSRGGRPDLAGQRLARVKAPTLLVVGGADQLVLDLNRQAQTLLTCVNRLEVIPGATHLFEEPGALERVADLAQGWFTRHFARLASERAASRRNHAALAREAAARARDAALSASADAAQLTRLWDETAAERQEAADQRQAAAKDRDAATILLEQVRQDRRAAAADQFAAAQEREAAATDREAAAADRQQAAVERAQERIPPGQDPAPA
jgi:putative phosphoribosyl transferase